MHKRNKIFTIGITGSESGVGVTHISITLSRYIKFCLGRKVCLISEDMGEESYVKDRLKVLGVDVYAKENSEKAIFENGYEYAVKDYGIYTKAKGEAFKKESHGIFVLSSSFWAVKVFSRLIYTEVEDEYKTWTFITCFGDEDTIKVLNRKYDICIHRYPYTYGSLDIDMPVYTFFKNKLGL